MLGICSVAECRDMPVAKLWISGGTRLWGGGESNDLQWRRNYSTPCSLMALGIIGICSGGEPKDLQWWRGIGGRIRFAAAANGEKRAVNGENTQCSGFEPQNFDFAAKH